MPDFNPWRYARDNHPDYLIDRSHKLPPGLRGCIKGNTIYLCSSLDRDSLRCTLCHELWHIKRETNHSMHLTNYREEMAIDKLVARQLIHIDAFIAAIPFGNKVPPTHAAEELRVDHHTLRVWFQTLSADECRYIETRLRERDHP